LLRSSTRRAGLSLGDRCCVALALTQQLPVLTADKNWLNLVADLKVTLVRN
jgi:ribonuclease VapC